MTWAAVAVGGGSAIGGAMGGKKGGGKSKAADLQAQLAGRLFSETDPLRQGLIGRSQDFISGGSNVTETPAYLALKSSSDHNFNRAQDNIIGNTAPGGALTSALAGLEGDRASTLTQGAGALYGDELSRALALSTGITGQSLNSLGQAGNVQAGLAAANSQENAGKAQGMGSGLGALLGGK